MSLVGAVDAVSRRLAIDLLLHMAKNMEHRQFLFITPQDLSSVQPTDFVRTQTRYPPPSACGAFSFGGVHARVPPSFSRIQSPDVTRIISWCLDCRTDSIIWWACFRCVCDGCSLLLAARPAWCRPRLARQISHKSHCLVGRRSAAPD